MKPLSVTRFLTVWSADCEFKRVGRQQIEIYEPLNTDAPETAHPYWNSLSITFYSANGNTELGKCHTHNLSRGVSPEILLLDGDCWEVSGGEVKFVRGHWHMVWFGWRNTRAARSVRAGLPHYHK